MYQPIYSLSKRLRIDELTRMINHSKDRTGAEWSGVERSGKSVYVVLVFIYANIIFLSIYMSILASSIMLFTSRLTGTGNVSFG